MRKIGDKEQEQLSLEQLAGGKAQNAYDQYIGPFVEEKRQLLFQSFCDLPMSAEKELMDVKRMLFAIDSMEAEIMTVIETGKMASIVLNEQEVKH